MMFFLITKCVLSEIDRSRDQARLLSTSELQLILE